MNPERAVLIEMALNQSIVEFSSTSPSGLQNTTNATLTHTAVQKEDYEKLDQRHKDLSDNLAVMMRLSRLGLVSPGISMKNRHVFDGENALKGMNQIGHLWLVKNFFGENVISGLQTIDFGKKLIETDKIFISRFSFAINKNGYDLALKYIEHNDQEKRFRLSTAISLGALVAALSIAIGSIGNLMIKLL